MIVAQLGFRAWAVLPSWFYTDDYRLMLDAQDAGLSLNYLLTPFDSQFMPFGRLLVWVVSSSGTMNWGLAATTTLLLQAAAGAACLWMLVSLFGARWAILAPLAIYLTSVLTMPALMWWAAAVNQIPLQIVFFVTLTTWVRYLRSRRLRWLGLTALTLAVGLLCYVKAILIVPVLLFVALMYFGEGPPLTRLRSLLRSYWPAVVAVTPLALGYLVFYRTSVPQPFEDSGEPLIGEVADSMLGTSLSTGLLGGPWQWWNTNAPIVLADPPEWTVHASWVIIAFLVAYSVLLRSRALRGWLLLAGYAFALFLLLVTSRGQLFGRLAGLEYRYLTDISCVVALVLGLVFLRLRGAPGSSRAREEPLIRVRVAPVPIALFVAAVSIGGLVSSTLYVSYWHHDNAGRSYLKNLEQSLGGLERPPQLASQTLPSDVMPAYTKPDNQSSRLLKLFGKDSEFPESTEQLLIIDDSGHLVPAEVTDTFTSTPGPTPGCGWKITPPGRTIALTGETFDWSWWVKIGYLASNGSPVTVRAGQSRVETRIRTGLHTLFVRADGEFDSITITGLDAGTTMCVDRIDVGDPEPPEE